MERECDNCGELTERKNLGKINGKFLCKKCRVEVRKKHREETIESQGIKEDLRELENRYKREKGYWRKSYEKKILKETGHLPRKFNKKNTNQENNYIPKRYQIKSEDNQVQESQSPIKIKGSNIRKTKVKSNSYLTMQESQDILKMFMSRGLTFNKAKEKKEKLIKQLKETKLKLKEQNKEIPISKKELLQELWNS